MKNFRKVLALVLVVATLLSFATMASAAKKETLNLDYADQETITPAYEAAVDVLTSLGILNGYESGEEFYFKPSNEIDRDEVAKMVAVLANAGDDIQDYFAEACTFADVKGTWAASYVAYCYHAGYVDGRNATTFDPDASITGIEVAKMMLCVMGFDADAQGYVGKDWKVNVLRDAKKVNLFDGMEEGFNPATNAKREEVAQMMFNMLQANIIVGYVSDNIVKITNSVYDEMNITLKDISDGDFILYGQAIAIPGETVGDMFGFEHKVVVDCQGRPYNQWKYVTDSTQWAKVYPIPYLTRSTDGIKEVDTTYLYQNGQLLNAADAKYDGLYKDVKGLIVETYKFWNVKNDAYETITVVLDTEVTFVEWVGRYQGAPYFKTLGSNDYVKNTEGFEEGDVVLVHFCNVHTKLHNKYVEPGSRQVDYTKGEHDAYLADVEVAEVSDASFTNSRYDAEWNRENSYFKADGEKYEYHYNALGELVFENNDPAIADTYMNSESRGVEYALFRDEAGYVVLWTDAENLEEDAEYEYGYFVENSWTIELGDKITPDWDKDDNYFVNAGYSYYNDMVDFGAKLNEDVEIDAEFLAEIQDIYDEETVGLLAQYVVEDGIAYITARAHMNHRSGVVVGVGDVDPDAGVSATTNTEILVRTFDPADGEYTYTAYQGYKELAKDYPGVIYSYGNEPAEIQYFVSETNPNKATHIFIDAAYATAEDTFFLLGWEETRTSLQTGALIEYFEVFSAVIDGELAHVLIDTDMIEEGESPATIEPGLYNNEVMYLGVSVDGLPVYKYAGMSLDVLDADVAEWVEMDGDQLYYEMTDGTVENFPLADEFTMWVVTISYNEDEGTWSYVDIDSYTDDEKFNDEMINNAGYEEVQVYVEYNELGLLEEGYIVRFAEYTEKDEDPNGFFS